MMMTTVATTKSTKPQKTSQRMDLLNEEQFPGSEEFAKLIREERASTPFRVRYQEFQENRDKYKSLFTTIHKRGK